MKELIELLSLEKSGQYQEALDQVQTILHNSKEEKSARAFNLKLLEQRLRFKLLHSTKKTKTNLYQFKPTKTTCAGTKTWSALITLWKRQDYLAEQLTAIRSQSIPPQEIIIIKNENHISESTVRKISGDNIKIIQSDLNSLYTRWAISYDAIGEYVSIFDDDTIPGKNWIANSIRACSKYNALVGSSGRIYNKEGIHGFFKIVMPNKYDDNTISCNDTDVYCDWVCNSYFFKREWVKYALNFVRYNNLYKTFDDIQLATSLYLSGGIQCVTPMQPTYDKSLSGNLKYSYGNDSNAIWKTNSDKHFKDRKSYINHLIEDGYTPVQQRENLVRFHLIVPFGERTSLERCLLSIKGQNYKNFTCTLIDDCCDGDDALEMIHHLGLGVINWRYIKTTRKAYPLRAREVGTDMLDADPADVIVHLDGDDWLPYPDVLSRLNCIYRKGSILVTYGNAVNIKEKVSLNFQEYSYYEMSKRWNITQKNSVAKVIPFNRIEVSEIINGWQDAPWCGMHLRTFKFSKWIELNRKTFRDKNENYLRVGTDAATLIPILNACRYESIQFIPELAYVYKNGNNTIHAKNEVSTQLRASSLEAIATADMSANHAAISHALIHGNFPAKIDDAIIIYDAFHGRLSSRDIGLGLGYSESYKSQGGGTSIVTIVTPNYLADAIVCLMSYRRNLRSYCHAYVYVATENSREMTTCAKILESSALKPLFPTTLRHTRDKSHALADKYGLNSDEYRWAMKALVLLELLCEGMTMALFLDPDTYTVSDISDVHQELTNFSISVFPHFRDPDNEYLRGVLYKDGFFNGGMLAATQSGLPHLVRLYERCLCELVKDPVRHRWDDQKYFDFFILEVKNIYVNQDRGIDYNPWNYEPVEGLIAPSQRSILLKSGFFVRHWHVSTMLIHNSIELNEQKFKTYRPFVSIYLMSLLYTIVLLLKQAVRKGTAYSDNLLGLISRYESIENKLNQISNSIPTNSINILLSLTDPHNSIDLKTFLEQWVNSVVNSICFDNFTLFSLILGSLFADQDFTVDLQKCLLKRDIRYLADDVIGSPESSNETTVELLDSESPGELVKKRIQALQACNIFY